jgi:hypothetical protein
MSTDTESRLPNIAEILSQVLASVPRERQPLLIAFAERMAAARYREWAADPSQGKHRTELLACADREEQIADCVEGLYPGGAAIQRAMMIENPALEEINRSLFAGRPLEQQFTIQARGERLGAATWRSFAAHEKSPAAREILLACATLEEESAAVLESFLENGDDVVDQ